MMASVISLITILRLKCDGTRAETRFRLSAKQSTFNQAGASVQSTTGSRGVRISGSNGSNAAYTMFRSIVKSTGYPLHSPVSPSFPLLASPCAITFQPDSTMGEQDIRKCHMIHDTPWLGFPVMRGVFLHWCWSEFQNNCNFLLHFSVV